MSYGLQGPERTYDLTLPEISTTQVKENTSRVRANWPFPDPPLNNQEDREKLKK